MGACILCGKSAGFFYSLHKDCFARYESSEKSILNILSDQLAADAPVDIAEHLRSYVSSLGFSDEASQRTLIRALEKFSASQLEKFYTDDYQDWLELLDKLALDESMFINSNFILQQINYPVARNLRAGILPLSNANQANFTVQMSHDEEMWWCFSSSHIETLRPKQEQKSWSVLTQIINNMLPAKKKNLLEAQELGKGKIWLTNRCLYYESEAGVESFDYKRIYACTPVKNGVRLQLETLNSRPQTFYCEDGRLLFEFIHYALKR